MLRVCGCRGNSDSQQTNPLRGGKWVSRRNQFSGPRRDLLMEMIATHRGTHRLFISPTPITVYRITGERDPVPPCQITVTYLPRLLVGEETTYPQVRVTARNAVNEITRKPRETIAAAATWLIGALCASAVNHNHPHATKSRFSPVFVAGRSCGPYAAP